MKCFWQHRKTTSAGIAMICVALGDLCTYAAKGELSPNLYTDVMGLITGFMGLVAADGKLEPPA